MNYKLKRLQRPIAAVAISAFLSLGCLAQTASEKKPIPQNAQPNRIQPPKEMPSDRVAILVMEWTRAKTGAQEYIEAMPEDGISFRPTAEIRTFAEQMLHLSGGNYMFGATASGQANPYEKNDPEKMEDLKKNKAALLKFVMGSYDFVINAVKGLTVAKLDQTADLFGMKMPCHLLLTKGIEHQAHHRGQTTIYLRLKGVTPPSERLF